VFFIYFGADFSHFSQLTTAIPCNSSKENSTKSVKLIVRCEHLSRIFKQDTGFCISEYRSVIRLQKEQLLLRSARQSVPRDEAVGLNTSKKDKQKADRIGLPTIKQVG